jgi:hypothetical protein
MVGAGPMTRNQSLTVGKALLLVLGLTVLGVIPNGTGPSGMTRFELAVPALAQPRDPIVTSDSPEYCGVLMDRITGITRTTAMPPPTEAAVLSEEGERMCVRGQTRGGILRLRRALEILRHGED